MSKIPDLINLDHIPGPRGLSFLKGMARVRSDILGMFQSMLKDFGPIVSFPWPMNSVFVYDPRWVRQILVEEARLYVKGDQNKELEAILGKGLATNDDPVSWLRNRQIIAKEFSPKSVQVFSEAFKAIVTQELDTFKEGEIEMSEAMKVLTFKIVCRTLLGRDLNVEETDKVISALIFTSEVTYERIFQLFPRPYWLPTPTNFRFKRHMKALHEIVMDIIEQERQRPVPDVPKSMLEKLVHSDEKLTTLELRDEVLTFVVAGHETSAHALTWIMGLLAKNPDKQIKLIEHIRAAGPLKPHELLNQIPYLEWVIFEGMRLYPSFPVISKKNTQPTRLGNYTLPKGTNVVIPIYVIQRDALSWEDPLAFRPERFEDGQAENSDAFLPFSRGPRKCIGELFAMNEMAVVVYELVRKFELQLVRNDLPREAAYFSLRPLEDLQLKLSVR